MELALRFGATAGVAVAAAGLIAVAPVAQPDLDGQLQQRTVELAATTVNDVIYVLNEVIGQGGSQILGGLQDFVNGPVNFAVVAPEMLGIGIADILVGQDILPYNWIWWGSIYLPETLNELIQLTQNNLTTWGVDYISSGLQDLSQGIVNVGLTEIVSGVDSLIIATPEDLALGTASVLWDTFISAW